MKDLAFLETRCSFKTINTKKKRKYVDIKKLFSIERERERERERRTNKKRITIETSNRVGVFRYSVNWLIYISNNSCFEHKRTNYSINAIYPFDGEEK